MTGYESQEICLDCGGRCCKAAAPVILPSDLPEISLEHIVSVLREGFVLVDYWEGGWTDEDGNEFPGYFLRYRDASDPGNTVCRGSWGARCHFLTDTGCYWPFEKRPWNCRFLKPATGIQEDCLLTDEKSGERINPKKHAIGLWLPYTELIEAAIESIEKEAQSEKA